MSTDPLTMINTRATPQSQPADPAQIPNHAGGYSFVADDLNRLRRFLTIGTTGGTFYVSERDLTIENADLVLDAARNRCTELVDLIVEISTAGRAPRQQPCLFALAAALNLGDLEGRRAAQTAVRRVVRTGTQMFQFARYVEQFGGWGRGTRRAVGDWYAVPDIGKVAYQAVKYRQRDGYTHADILRLAHPITVESKRFKAIEKATARILDLVTANAAAEDTGDGSRLARAMALGNRLARLNRAAAKAAKGHATRKMLFDWIAGKATSNAERGLAQHCGCHDGFRVGGHMGDCPNSLLDEFEAVQRAGTAREVVAELQYAKRLPWETIPDQFLNDPTVWETLLANGIPQTALIRQLPRLTRIGLLTPMSDATRTVIAQLTDPDRLRKARVHPLNLLVAQRTYAAGQSARGDSTWTPVQSVVDALDAAHYAAYGMIEPTRKRIMSSLDVSASMTWHPLAGMLITPREASAALALATVRVEDRYVINGFSSGMVDVPISPRQRLDDAIRTIEQIPMGGTDCALPMLHAERHGIEVDLFVQYTDGQTWEGRSGHPHQALAQYRRASGINAKLVIVAMEATKMTLADPSDLGMLDIAGMDTTVPNVISDFARS